MSHQKAIVASLIIEHTVNFALSGNSQGPCNYLSYKNVRGRVVRDIRLWYRRSRVQIAVRLDGDWKTQSTMQYLGTFIETENDKTAKGEE